MVSFGSNVHVNVLPRRPAVLQRASPSSELIQEVSVGVGPSIQPPLGGSIRELKRTINLPDEYSEFRSWFFWFLVFIEPTVGKS